MMIGWKRKRGIYGTAKALQEIRTKSLQPIYLVTGTEKFLQEQVRQAFLTRFEVSKDDLNFASFDMEREPLDLVIQEAQSLPFFGDQRLIFVERPFSNSRKKPMFQNMTLMIFAVFKNPMDTAVLVILPNMISWMNERKSRSS